MFLYEIEFIIDFKNIYQDIKTEFFILYEIGEVMSTNNLPQCKFIEVLTQKVEQRNNTSFDFFGTLEAFRKIVSQEVRQINQLFPEYTPHDEEYHLTRLFHVADTILSENSLNDMNTVELYILAISLYGHDWGMAVCQDEKNTIIGLLFNPNNNKLPFALIENEHLKILLKKIILVLIKKILIRFPSNGGESMLEVHMQHEAQSVLKDTLKI